MNALIDTVMLVFILSNQLMLYYRIGRLEGQLEKIKEVIENGGSKKEP